MLNVPVDIIKRIISSFVQIANAQTARVVWEELLQKYPEVIGKENPLNDKIKSIFGDQGGYR